VHNSKSVEFDQCMVLSFALHAPHFTLRIQLQLSTCTQIFKPLINARPINSAHIFPSDKIEPDSQDRKHAAACGSGVEARGLPHMPRA
jgi:hypothetical protein